MKRADLMRLLERQGCRMFREGAKHTVYLNPTARRVSTVPRHVEIDEWLARKICKDLGVIPPDR